MDNVVIQALTIAISGLTIAFAIVAITILTTKKETTNAEAGKPIVAEAQAKVSVADDPDPEDCPPKTNEVEALIRKIRELEGEKEALRRELWKSRGKPPEILGFLFIPYGVIAFVLSVFLDSLTLSYIGLGLTLWGALLLFIRPTRYVKSKILNSITISPLTTIHQLIKALNYKGKGVYLPPQYIKESKGGTIFVPYKKGETMFIPPIEEVSQEKVFFRNPKGIFLTSPGLSLANLFENELKKDFAKVDLNYLQKNLSKLFIEGLKIAEDFEMGMEGDTIRAIITGTVCGELCKETRKVPNVCSLGCPLCSSIAIVLTRVTGKPIVIENNQLSEGGREIEVYYRTLGNPSTEFSSEEQTGVAKEEVATVEVSADSPLPVKLTVRDLGYLLPNLVGLVLVALGSYTLVWVGWSIWYDITTWSKSLALIFFGSILFIGLVLLFIVLALLLPGIFAFFRKRLRKE